MKICAACHTELPKESYSKKQWKLDQRRWKECTANNREVQPPTNTKQDNNDPPGTEAIIKYLDSKCMEYAGKKINDKELFKQPPAAEDCLICFIRIPNIISGIKYQTCCGKVICSGCIHAPLYDDQGNEVENKKCAFCRVPTPSSEEEQIKRIKKRVDANDPIAIRNTGNYYRDGRNGYRQGYGKALELYNRAGELGNAEAYNSIGVAYDKGRGVEVDEKKAMYYYELAAKGGDVMARYNLGVNEEDAGNMERAVKHFMISVRGGYNKSLDAIKQMYSNGNATKDDYTKALQSYQAYLGEIKSPQRDKAAVTYENCQYY